MLPVAVWSWSHALVAGPVSHSCVCRSCCFHLSRPLAALSNSRRLDCKVCDTICRESLTFSLVLKPSCSCIDALQLGLVLGQGGCWFSRWRTCVCVGALGRQVLALTVHTPRWNHGILSGRKHAASFLSLVSSQTHLFVCLLRVSAGATAVALASCIELYHCPHPVREYKPASAVGVCRMAAAHVVGLEALVGSGAKVCSAALWRLHVRPNSIIVSLWCSGAATCVSVCLYQFVCPTAAAHVPRANRIAGVRERAQVLQVP